MIISIILSCDIYISLCYDNIMSNIKSYICKLSSKLANRCQE